MKLGKHFNFFYKKLGVEFFKIWNVNFSKNYVILKICMNLRKLKSNN